MINACIRVTVNDDVTRVSLIHCKLNIEIVPSTHQIIHTLDGLSKINFIHHSLRSY